MVKKIKRTFLLVIVFVIGVVTGLIGSSFLWHRGVLAPLTANQLIDFATDARLITTGETDSLLKHRVMSLPPLTKTYYEEMLKYMPDDNFRLQPLWQVQRYYEATGDEVPAEIKPILDTLPPRPPTCCEKKLLKEAGSLQVEGMEEN